MKRQLTALMAMVALVVGLYPQNAQADILTKNLPKLEAKSYIVSEGDEILFGEAYDNEVPAGNLGQMMTALLAIEKGELDKRIKVPELPNNINEGNRVYLRPGEEVSVEDLISAVVIDNATDAAYTLASYIGGDEEKFVAAMNEKAAALGMSHTVFKSSYIAVGDGKTTAQDIAKLAQAAAENSTYKSLAQKRSLTWNGDTLNNETLENVNMMGEKLPEGIGLKSGAVGDGTFNYAAAVSLDGRDLVAVILQGKDLQTLPDDMSKILQLGADGTSLIHVIEKGDVLGTLSFTERKNVRLTAEKSYTMTLPTSAATLVTYKLNLNHINLPIEEGDTLGVAEIYLGEEKVGEVNVLSLDKAGRTLHIVPLLLSVLGVIYLLSIVYRLLRTRRKPAPRGKKRLQRLEAPRFDKEIGRKLFGRDHTTQVKHKGRQPSQGSSRGRQALEQKLAEKRTIDVPSFQQDRRR